MRLKVYDKNTNKWVYADRSFGKIPVRGVDYYTEDDKVEFENFIATELAKRGQLEPEYANAVKQCTDTTKLYVLPDGYIYAYMKMGGYTNLVPESTDLDGNVFNGIGYQDGYALNYATSGTTLIAQTGFTTTGFIPFVFTDVLRLSGVTWTATNRSCIEFYDENKEPLGNYIGNGYVNAATEGYRSDGIKGNCLEGKDLQSVATENGVTTFSFTFYQNDIVHDNGDMSFAGYRIKYFRISAQGNGEDMVITLNEEIDGAPEGGYQWRNTGHAFVPADYEERINNLEEKSTKNKDDVKELQQQVNDIVEGNTAIAAISKFDPSAYNIPVLHLTGSTVGMSKDIEVSLEWAFGENSGTCTLKWQGSSSIAYDKKNYTIKLDKKIEVVEGWGEQKKYCLKANFIDPTHARNLVSAKLWGQIVASRNPKNTTLASCPNYGAVDGFPIAIMLNGEFHGLYTWNIPKDFWTYNMGSGTQEAVICANYYVPATDFRVPAVIDGSDFELEEVTDEDNSEWVATSFNILLNALNNSYGADLDTTIAQYMDWKSAIDYYIYNVIEDGRDACQKNCLLTTYDGVKWIWNAYDRDSTYGTPSLEQLEMYPANAGISFNYFRRNRVMELIYRFKTNELKARYKELRAGILSEDNICVMFETFACGIPSRLLDEDVKKWPSIPRTSASTVDQILRWLHRRLAVVDKWIEEIPEQETPIAPSSRSGNLVPTSKNKSGGVYNGIGYKDGYIIEISNGVESEVFKDGCCITGYIPFTKDKTVKVTTDSWNISPENSRIIFYNSNFEPMAYYTQHGFVGVFNGYDYKTAIQDKSKQSVTYGKDGMTTLNIAYGANCTDVAYIRIRGVGRGANMAVTIE